MPNKIIQRTDIVDGDYIPTSDQKGAMDAASAPSASNPFLTQSGGTSSITISVISTSTQAVKNICYVLSGGTGFTLTLPSSPTVGDSLEYVNLTTVLTCTIARNGQKIMNLSEDLTLNKLNDGHVIRFSGAALGWVFI